MSATSAGLFAVDLASLEIGRACPLDRLEQRAAGAQSAVHRQPRSFSDPALDTGERVGEQDSGAQRAPGSGRLGNDLWISAFIAGDLGGGRTLSGNMLSGSQLDPPGVDTRAWPHGPAP